MRTDRVVNRRIPIPMRSTTYSAHLPQLTSAHTHTEMVSSKLQSAQQSWLAALSSVSNSSYPHLHQHNHQTSSNFPTSLALRASQTLGKGMNKAIRWSRWVWWVLVEVILLWAVFRVTLDYAGSGIYLGRDPFHPLSRPLGLGPPPSLSSPPSLSASGMADMMEGGRETGRVTDAQRQWAKAPRYVNLEIPIPGSLRTLVGKQGSANFFDLVESWGWGTTFFGEGEPAGGWVGVPT